VETADVVIVYKNHTYTLHAGGAHNKIFDASIFLRLL